jgi:tRNA1Val (adenine37-N6)-methyltransferase
MSKPFEFKEFTIRQDQCAMKIGTDGVLLGAWTSLESDPDSILDIGSGTGIIALQLAQRSDAETIDAIEIDAKAYEQAVGNFENSDWADRLFCYHASVEEFALEIDEKYDLIVSNPPFYTDTFESENDARNKARLTSSLSFETLLHAVANLLSAEGVFSVIIPFKEEENFIQLASQVNLLPTNICRVKGTPITAIKRSLLAFSFHKKPIETIELIIETSRHQYTDAYIKLVKEFYLKM